MTPLSAALPYSTLLAPLIISTCSTSSMGIKLQLGLPMSPLKIGNPSTNSITRLPAP
jgi:hypothetical protein